MPVLRTCQRSAEVRDRLNETSECITPATHFWHSFWMCERHAQAYNDFFGPAVNYQRVSDGGVAVEPWLIAPEHAGAIYNGECTSCSEPVHRCAYHNTIGCRNNMAGGGRCTLCPNCVRDSEHRHCSQNYCVVDGGFLCENCGACEDCRRQSSYDDSLCYRCYEYESERENSVIHAYHEYELPKARPVMRDGLHKGQPFLWMGVELECEMKNGSKHDAAKAVYDEFGEGSAHPYVVLADDCSLNDGFETITGPMSLTHHQELWLKLAPFMVKQGCRSFEFSTTGMHVHVSRNFFSQLEIGKMLVFLNARSNRDKIVKLAGRDSEQYARLYPKRIKDVLNGSARYEGLNLTNDNTLEFRIFKGTLKPGHILANLEFVHALSMYVKNASVRVMEDWPLFWQYVAKDRRAYRHLIEFFELEVESAA